MFAKLSSTNISAENSKNIYAVDSTGWLHAHHVREAIHKF